MKIKITPLTVEGKQRIKVTPASFDPDFPAEIKRIKGRRWSPDERCWHIPYTKPAYRQLCQVFGEANKRKFIPL